MMYYIVRGCWFQQLQRISNKNSNINPSRKCYGSRRKSIKDMDFENEKMESGLQLKKKISESVHI